MKIKLVGLLLLCFLSLKSQAQNIAGKVIGKNNNPVEFAVIVVQTIDSVYVSSTYTDSLGLFTIRVDLSPFILTVNHLMYETHHNLYNSLLVGNIELIEKNITLSEVSVVGDRPIVKVVDGKMTYNAEQLLQNKMAVNAYEAILELPGIEQRNGKIELAGVNEVTVIINGKRTNMGKSQLETLLKSMPKERIKEAEIMYSAPPQYHVRGAVVNLVLKSGELNDASKLQGEINALYNQGYYANFQLGATLVYNAPKTTTDFIYSFGYKHNLTGEDILSHHLYKEKIYDIKQFDRGYSKSPTHTMRFGNEWRVNDKNIITTAYTTEIEQWSRPYTSSYGTFSDSENRKESDKPTQMHNLEFGYTSGFGFSTGVDFTSYSNHSTQYYQEKMVGKEDHFSAKSKQDIKRLSIYADQKHSLGGKWVINYGTKFSFASDNSSQIYYPLGDNDWSKSNSKSKLNEYVYDIYAGFSKSFTDKLSLSASLMGEYYKHKEIAYLSVFPAMELTYKLNLKNIFQLSISSDKTYPSYWEMQNTTSYLNGYTEIQGNTDLKPSRLYSAQLNYILKNKYIFTLYANYIDNNFNQLPYQSSERLVLVYKTLNFDYSSKFGLNVVVPFKIGSVVDSRITLNGYYDKVKSSHFHDISFERDNFALYANLNNIFNISSSPNIKAELSASYITRNIQGPMLLSRMYSVDAGVKWSFNSGNMELLLRVNDMFNSWTPKELDFKYKTQDLVMLLIPDSRVISLSFVYKFGSFKAKQHKALDRSRFLR